MDILQLFVQFKHFGLNKIVQLRRSQSTKLCACNFQLVCVDTQAVRRLGGVKSQSASERWKKKQKKAIEEPPQVTCRIVG